MKNYSQCNSCKNKHSDEFYCHYCTLRSGTPLNYYPESKSIPIKPMPTIEPLDKYKTIGESIGKLVDEKNKAYGDSFNKSSEFLKILYPNGVPVEAYSDMLGIIRVFDKLMRIATAKDALGENPWKDICGYSILKSEESK